MAYYTVQGFIGAPQSLRRTMLASVHGSTIVRWLREASEEWNTEAFLAVSDTIASYPESNTDYVAAPLPVQGLVSRLEATEAGFILAAIHAGFSNSDHTVFWGVELEDGFQPTEPNRYTVNRHESSVSLPHDEINPGESGAKSGRTLTAEDSIQLALEVQRSMSTRWVLKVFAASGEARQWMQVEDLVADLRVLFQTYLETMNRHGVEAHYAEFEKALESFGAAIPEGSGGLNSLDYLMTI